MGYRPKDQTTIDRVVELNNKLGLGHSRFSRQHTGHRCLLTPTAVGSSRFSTATC
ncbi:MAG: hypothetical protein MZV63_08250 [Marinilabiliales bacterium]|nr:hypothetical protein [Marinilabiliales bacterium]